MVLPDPAALVRPGAPPTGASMRMFSSLRFCLLLLILLCSGRSPCSRENHYFGTTSTYECSTTYTRLLAFAGKKYFHKFVRVAKFGAAESYDTARSRLELYRIHAAMRAIDRPRIRGSCRRRRRLRLRRARRRVDGWIMALGLGEGSGHTWRTTRRAMHQSARSYRHAS
jgi:hypothetical protein